MKDPENPSVLNSQTPPVLESIILKTLRKDPEHRYQTANELLKDLNELKRNLENKSKVGRRELGRNDLEAKTRKLKDATGNSINETTDYIKKLSSRKIFLTRITNKFQTVYKSKAFPFLLLGLIITPLITYTLLSNLIPTHSSPSPEAVNLYNLGTDALRDGTYFKASRLLNEALKIDNNLSFARARLAEAWLELDYSGRAQKEMLKVHDLERKQNSVIFFTSKSKDSLYIDAIDATLLRDFPRAVSIYETLAQNYPKEPHVYIDLGRALEKNDEIDKAIESYEKAISLNSQYGAAFLRLGVLLSRKGQYEQASSAFEKAENIYDRMGNDEGIAEVKFNRGVSFTNQDKFDLGVNQFNQVIENKRANKFQKIRVLFKISSLLCSQGKMDSAQNHASEAIQLAQEEQMENLTTGGLIDLGNAFFAKEEYVQAEKHFRKALEIAQNNEGNSNQARAALSLGSLFVEQHKPNEALQFINEALPFYQKGAYSREASQAYILLGFAYKMKGDNLAATQSFEKVIVVGEPSQRALALTGIGTLLNETEQYPKALQYFEQSNNLYQSLGNSYYTIFSQFNLADVLSKLGYTQKANQLISLAEQKLNQEKIPSSQLKYKFKLLKARISFLNKDFVSSKNFITHVNETDDLEIQTEKYGLMCLCETFSHRDNRKIMEFCNKSLEYAFKSHDLRRINIEKLHLAEAFFNIGDYEQALKNALEAKDYFYKTGRKESAWISLLIAAKASKQRGDNEFYLQYLSESVEYLLSLKKDWGDEHFDSYAQRLDIKNYLEETKALNQKQSF